MDINVNQKRGYLELRAENEALAVDREFLEIGNLKFSVGKDQDHNITNIMIMNADKIFGIDIISCHLEEDEGFERASY
jgi:hypothetical protein